MKKRWFNVFVFDNIKIYLYSNLFPDPPFCPVPLLDEMTSVVNSSDNQYEKNNKESCQYIWRGGPSFLGGGWINFDPFQMILVGECLITFQMIRGV